MATLLKGILISGLEESRSILIEDSTEHNGRIVLKKSLNQLITKYDNINVVLSDFPQKVWSQGLSDTMVQKVSFTEYLNDPLKWNDKSIKLDEVTSVNSDSFLFHTQHGYESTRSALLVDNLSTLLLHYDYTDICRTISRLCRNYAKCIFLIHYDVHEDHVMQALHHMMSSVIRLLPSQLCCIRHKRKSGKILKEVNRYKIVNEDIVCEKVEEKSTKLVEQVTGAIDPAANLTFDLRLTDSQKEDRSRVVLPYTQVQQGQGRITYQLDEVDDWDESDPDDDLDI